MTAPLEIDTADLPLAGRCYQLPTLVVRMLRQYFTEGQERWFPGVQHLRYAGEEGPRKREDIPGALEINRIGDRRGETTDLPKLLVRRNAVARLRVGLVSGKRMSPSTQGAPIYEKLIVGSMAVFCMSKLYDESELLGTEVFELLSHFEEDLRKRMCLAKFSASQMAEVGALRTFPGFFATPVILDYSYRDNVKITPSRFPYRELQLEIK